MMANKFHKAMLAFSSERINSVDRALDDVLEYREAEGEANVVLQELTRTLNPEQMKKLEDYFDKASCLPMVYAQKVYELAFYDGIGFAREMEGFGDDSN
ncbi:hypothetical protein [Listeria booriae]|uniref:hypothetical protein n=1 Tax=Listeria booriae TaxID=1552123 RepID=UPI001628A4BC|nr:hypothetical protein [Listeria booriae]MBC1524464.1 hypothetical protein [Listeria booriae]MBC6306442.1 hypothetical protein [Listeria booriae]